MSAARLPAPPHGIPRAVGLHRERLTDRLDRLPDARLGLVVAPPGYGKTALMADWARLTGSSVAWHRVTREDCGERLLARIGPAWGIAGAPDAEAILEHLSGRPGSHVLVIDDVHLLATDSARAVVETLVRGLPETASVLLGGRRAPDLDLLRSEVSVNPVLIGPDDLRFRSWEVESLFRDVYGEPLLPDEAAALARHTGGWAAALHLFHLSTTGQPVLARRRALQSLAGRNRYARGYLSQQVLVGLGPDLSEFLRRTAAFDVLTAARCDALLGRSDSQQTLEHLVAQQALTITDDDGATFRYHEVLRRHLEAELEAELGEAGLRDWYGRAATILEEQGALTEALRVRARARDWAGVRALLLRSGREIASREASWTGLLPTAMLHDDPWIELAQAQRLLADGQLRPAAETTRGALTQLDDPRAEDRAREVLAVTRAWESLECPPTRRWHEQVAEGLRTLRPWSRSARQGGRSRSDALARPFLLLLNGNITGALQAQRHAAALAEDGTSTYAALGLVGCLAARLAGDPTSRQLADAVATQAELDDLGWFTRASRALLAATDEDQARGAEDLRNVRDACDRRDDAWGAAWATMLEGLCSAVCADRSDLAALDDAAGRMRALGAAVPAAWMAALAALVAARTDAPDGAERAADAVRAAQEVACAGAHAAAVAALGWAQRDPAQLRAARALAQDNGVTLRPWAGWELDAPVVPRPRGGVVELTLLGRFDMIVDGHAPALLDLRPQARQLLRLLALNAGRGMHREQIAELMWPQQPPADGIHRLQVAISTLRQALGDDARGRGSGCVVERDGECYRLRLAPGSTVDVHEFEAALGRARRARHAGDARAQAAALQEALDRYEGDLLPEDGPAEWVVERRDELRARASGAASALADLLTGTDPRAAVTAAERAVALDGYNDAAWQRLISLHEGLGDLARAERARSAYADVLRELGIPAGAGRSPA